MGSLFKGLRIFAIALFLSLLLAGTSGCGSCKGSTTQDGGDATDLDGGDGGPGWDAGDGGPGWDGGDGGMGPRIFSVEPSGIPCKLDTDVLILGSGFEQGSWIELINCDTGHTITIDATGVQVTGDSEITFTVPAQADCIQIQGLYQLVIHGPSRDLETTCSIVLTANDPPVLLEVNPPYAYAGDPNDGVLSDRQVSMVGSGFRSTPAVRLVNIANPSMQYECTFVSFINSTSLTAVVPSESKTMPPGEYYVFLTNPDMLQAQWLVDTNNDGIGDATGIFKVTDTPPPIIDAIEPQRPGSNDCPLELEILGSGFTDDSSVILLIDPSSNCPSGTTEIAPGQCALPADCADANDPNNCSGNRLVVDLQDCPPKGMYPVRVQNPDGQYDDFYFLEVTESASQHLNDPFVDMNVDLLTGRQRLNAVAGFDAASGTHIFVAAGMDANRTVLQDVEKATVSIFGELGAWQQSVQYFGPNPSDVRRPNLLVTARHGHAMVRVGRHLYVIGGAAADTFTDPSSPVNALATIEVARIMGYENVPLVGTPQNLFGEGLPAGSWYYRVSAVMPNEGETLGSSEVNLRNTRGIFKVCWLPVAGASAYNIYRSIGADGRAGTGRLLAAGQAGYADGNMLCFDDDGHDALLPAPGWLRATIQTGTGLATGVWTYRVSASDASHETLGSYPLEITVADANQAQLLVRWNAPTTDATVMAGLTYNVYRSPNAGDAQLQLVASGITATEWLDDGTATPQAQEPLDGIPPLPPGSLTYWRYTTDVSNNQIDLNTPREGADAVAVRVTDGDTNTTDDPVYIYVAGGRTSNDITQASIYLDTTERIRVYDDGSLDPGGFIDESYVFNHPRAFYSLVTNAPTQDTPPPPDQPDCLIPDADGDGYISCECGGDDCNDLDPNVNPGAEEICEDGLDQDCDLGCPGGTDEPCPQCDPAEWDADGDGYLRPPCGPDCCDLPTDPGCPATFPAGIGPEDIYPGAVDYECDGVDEDCDGEDPCLIPLPPPPSGQCGAKAAKHLVLFKLPMNFRISMTLPLHTGLDLLLDAVRTPWAQGGARIPLPPFPETSGPIYLIALQGDEVYDNPPNGNNNGTADMEACQIDNTGSWNPGPNYNANYGGLVDCDTTTGANDWALQRPTTNRSTPSDLHGLRGVLYAGGIFVLGGATSEQVPTVNSISTTSGGTRFEFYDTGDPTDDPSTLISNRQNIGGGGFDQARAFFGFVRVNGKVFCIGGTSNGQTALNTVEAVNQ